MRGSSLVTIAIPVGPDAADPTGLLDSILAQTHESWHAIVVEGDQTSAARLTALPYVERDTRFTVLQEAAAAHLPQLLNAALRDARGSYFCWVSPQDQLLPNYLESLLGAFGAPDADVGMVVSTPESQPTVESPVAQPEADPLLGVLLRHNWVRNSGVMLSTDVVRGLGGFDERYRFDPALDLWSRVALRHDVDWLAPPLVRFGPVPQVSPERAQDFIIDGWVIRSELFREHTLLELLRSFSLDDEPETARLFAFLLDTVLADEAAINAHPLNGIFWDWVASGLKSRWAPDTVAQMLESFITELPEATSSRCTDLNLNSLRATVGHIATIAVGGASDAAAPTTGRPSAAIAITVRGSDFRGGGTIILYRYIEWLRDLGVAVTVYSDRPTPWKDLGVPFHYDHDDDARFAAITEEVVLLYSVRDFLSMRRVHPSGKRLVHLCQGYEGYHYGGHDYTLGYLEAKTAEEMLADKPYFEFLHRLPMERIVVSSHLRSLFREKVNQDPALILNGIDLREFTPVHREAGRRPFTVLASGSPADIRKGIGYLEKGIGLLAMLRPESLRLVIACGFDVGHELSKGSWFEEVLVHAYTEREMRELYAQADLLACSSLYEGFYLPALEAMACGLPVVTTANGGVEDACVDGVNCLMVPTADHEGLAAAILRIMDNPSIGEELAEAGVATVQRFSLACQLDMFVPVFEVVLGFRFDTGKVEALRSALAFEASAVEREVLPARALESEFAADAPDGSRTWVDAGPEDTGRFKMFLDPDSPGHGAHNMVLGDYDEVFHSALAPYDSFEGAVVWDIGAHVGYESLSFATLVGPTGRVVAFEPNLANVQEWQRNVAGNPDLAPRMEIRTTALSDVRGTAAFCVSSDVVGGASSGSHLADVTPPEASTSYEAFGLVQVECALADDLVEAGEVAPPALVKIDVEGAEANVLRGAIRTLQSHRPTLLIEVHHVRAMHDVDRVLSDVGYSVTVLESPEEIASRCFIKAVPSTLEGAGASEGPREYAVGRHTILLPAGHVLDTYQAEFPRYDIPLGEIARLVFAKRPLSAAIDVGANVGDTVALIRSFADVPVLCIEGSAEFLPLLRENAGRVGGDIDIVEAYVSDGTAVIDRGKAAQTESTSSVVDALAQDDTEGVQTRSLESILSEHPRFASSALLKIDTDGYDYPIIISSSEYLSRARPVVFFEYVTQGFGEQQEANSLEAVRTLLDGGYNRFVVYDCYGNFMVTACGIETFEELNTYLRSNRLGGVGAIRTWYLDVCAFHADDQDLFEELHRHELSLNLPEKG